MEVPEADEEGAASSPLKSMPSPPPTLTHDYTHESAVSGGICK